MNKYTTLHQLVQAIQAGDEPHVQVAVDNDSVYAGREVDEDDFEMVWEGDNPSDVLVELLTALGVRATR